MYSLGLLTGLAIAILLAILNKKFEPYIKEIPKKSRKKAEIVKNTNPLDEIDL